MDTLLLKHILLTRAIAVSLDIHCIANGKADGKAHGETAIKSDIKRYEIGKFHNSCRLLVL